MAKDKQTAFVLPESYFETLGTDEPQHFGSAPGLYAPGVPVTLPEMQTDLETMRALVSEHGLPLKEVKLDADYKAKPGESQFELRQRGDGSHLIPGPPEVETSEPVAPTADVKPDPEAVN